MAVETAETPGFLGQARALESACHPGNPTGTTGCSTWPRAYYGNGCFVFVMYVSERYAAAVPIVIFKKNVPKLTESVPNTQTHPPTKLTLSGLGRGTGVIWVGGFLAVGADQLILVGLDGESPQGAQLGWLGK